MCVPFQKRLTKNLSEPANSHKYQPVHTSRQPESLTFLLAQTSVLSMFLCAFALKCTSENHLLYRSARCFRPEPTVNDSTFVRRRFSAWRSCIIEEASWLEMLLFTANSQVQRFCEASILERVQGTRFLHSTTRNKPRIFGGVGRCSFAAAARVGAGIVSTTDSMTTRPRASPLRRGYVRRKEERQGRERESRRE